MFLLASHSHPTSPSSAMGKQRNSSPCTNFFSIVMNKFLKKQRSTDGPTAHDGAPSTLSRPVSPTLKKSSTSRWKKNKKLPEAKSQIDLSVALPSSDEFRTSLIMPALSTRFSMLREQDDPTSKLGKASDDSVLQPRRKSRMVDFGYSPGALFDIAEVSSLHGSIRPPVFGTSRQHSFVSDEAYSSDADAQPSVMSRARPGEGNILFGGRQKVYKIPTSGVNSTKSLGRLVYDDDVGMSAFQRYRTRERETDENQFPRPSDESQGFDFGLDQAVSGSREGHNFIGLDKLPNDSAKDLTHTSSVSSYDKKRSTTSSTARSEARSSTAATSITSQSAVMSAQPSPAQGPTSAMPSAILPAAPSPVPSLDRPGTKTKRLYEQGLDQHMQEQQSSAMSRLNSIQRQRGLSIKHPGPHLHSTRSTGNIHDRSAQQVYALRNHSPLPSPLLLNTTVRNTSSGASSPVVGAPQSPLESHWDDGNKVLTQALEPADRGKATALGAFNKPAQAFDEQQYLERQKTLQRSTSNAMKHKNLRPAPVLQDTAGIAKAPVQSSLEASDPAQSHSAPRKHEPTNAYNVFQNAVNQFPAMAPSASSASKTQLPDTHRTFFGDISASEDEDEESDFQVAQSFNQPENPHYNTQGRWQTQLQSVSEHPALREQQSRSNLVEEGDGKKTSDLKPLGLKPSASSRSLRLGVNAAAIEPSPDSPTLGPEAQGLNGMMHHLRQNSNHSSLYPAEEVASSNDKPPTINGVTRDTKARDSFDHTLDASLDSRSMRDSSYAVSNPWDLDEQGSIRAPMAGRNSTVSPNDDNLGVSMSSGRRSENSFVQDTEQTKTRPFPTREVSGVSLGQEEDLPSWQSELGKHHTRDASTATQQEREAFANELASRRAAIQETMKRNAEREAHSRAHSPAAGSRRAFGALRTKPSRESIVHAQEGGSKSGRSPAGQLERSGHSVEVSRSRGNSSPKPPKPASQHPAFKPEGPGPSDGQCRDFDPVQAERMLASSRSTISSGGRSRSNSHTTTGRSQSRTGPYRDDLEKAMIEGHGTSGAAHTPEVSPFPAMSPNQMLQGDYNYDGSTSPNYFDQQMLSHSTRSALSPVTLTPNVYSPGRPAPVANAFSQNHTPPLSSSTSSLPSSTHAPIVPSSARGPGLRKKTISKHDISEPTLISSTSNVDTVDLPEGASLKNGMEDAPPIPPINPRRRATRKLFGRHRSDSAGDYEPRVTVSDPNLLLNTSPQREHHFQAGPVFRMPNSAAASPLAPQHHSNSGSPERSHANGHTGGVQRAVTSPAQAGMF